VHSCVKENISLTPPSLPPSFSCFSRGETTARIRALKVNELSVSSYVKEVQAYSFGACVSYDAAQALDTDEDRVDELAGALYRYVLPSLPPSFPPSVSSLATSIFRHLLTTLPPSLPPSLLCPGTSTSATST